MRLINCDNSRSSFQLPQFIQAISHSVQFMFCGNISKNMFAQNTMMKKLLAICTVALLFGSCEKDVVRGTGSIVTEERSTADFNAISTFGSAKIYVSYAPEIKVKVKGYQNLVSNYKTDVEGNTLKLRYRDNLNVRNDNIEVYITMPGFNALTSNGSSSIKATGSYDGTESLAISTTGNAGISIDEMIVNNYTIESSGNSDIATLGVKSKSAKVKLSGNGTVTLSVQDKLDVHISGNGKVSYKGDPADINTDISGSGTVIKL
jgi:hypothetical protein